MQAIVHVDVILFVCAVFTLRSAIWSHVTETPASTMSRSIVVIRS